jgi:hypothetical protein
VETYHKIQTLFKRYQDGPKKGKMIRGDWTTPELEYLAGNQWEFTEKVDGTNIRVSYDPYLHPSDQVRFAGRTDNAQIPQPLLDYLMSTFTSYPYHVFEDASRVILFGEGYGPKIQGGGKYRDDHSFVLFDVKIGDWWLSRENVDDIAAKLGIESVPVIGTGTLHDAIDIVETGLTWNDKGHLINWGRGLVEGGLVSAWGNFEAEGIVARPVVPLFDRKGHRIITKIKAVDFR